MVAWLSYLGERIPIAVYAFLAAGLTLSAHYLATGSASNRPFALAFMGLILFLVTLRVMDDVKDYDKDLVAHPDRPLPKVVLSVGQAKSGIAVLFVLMGGWAGLIALLASTAAALWYIGLLAYLFFMYHEFFVRGWLTVRPLLYALSHQAIVFICCAFAIAVVSPEVALSITSLYYGMLIFGSFLAYEVCRKFDPDAHPVLMTYRRVYGIAATAAIVALAMAVAAAGAYGLGIHHLIWGIQLLVALATFLVPLSNARAYRSVEIAATVALAYHAWVIVIYHYS